MEVSYVEDKVTHAVINNAQAVEMGISDDADLFHMLSSGLYKNAELAVVREVMCNAWDAHIEAGIEDTPIDVSLDNGQLIIRDYGKAIPPEKMQSVYAIYGKSTKKSNSMVTGGFGLGCKSPFAYAEHFEVTNCHQGTKTIYNFSKSSAEVGGKYAMRIIVSVPTTETGIAVKVEIKPADQLKFRNYIKQIALYGEIKANFQGELLPTIPFSKTNKDWFITNSVDDRPSKINVKYGNVIYPVDSHESYEKDFRFVHNYLASLGYSTNYAMVFLAEPNTITMVPSREALKMSDRTIATLVGHFERFKDEFKKDMPSAYARGIQDNIDLAYKNTLYRHLVYIPGMSLPAIPSHSSPVLKGNLQNLDELSLIYLMNNYPRHDREFRHKEFLKRIKAIRQNKYADQGMVNSYRKALIKAYKSKHMVYDRIMGHKWYYKHVYSPLVRKLEKAGLSTKTLYVANNEGTSKNYEFARTIIKASEYILKYTEKYLPHLTNVILLSNNRHYVQDHVNDWKRKNKKLADEVGITDSVMLYTVPRNNVKMKEAREFFAKSGMVVIDVTEDVVHVPKPVVDGTPAPKEYVLRTAVKKKGLALLSNAVGSSSFDLHYAYGFDAKFSEDIEFVTQLRTKSQGGSSSLPGFYPRTSKLVVNLFGSKGGVIRSATQGKIWMEKKGALSLNEYVYTKLIAYLKDNKSVLKHLSMDYTSTCNKPNVRQWLDILINNDVFSSKLNIKIHKLTDEEESYLELWDALANDIQYLKKDSDLKKEAEKLQHELTHVPVNPKILKLMKAIEKNSLLSLVDRFEVEALIKEDDPNKQVEVKHIVRFVHTAINLAKE